MRLFESGGQIVLKVFVGGWYSVVGARGDFARPLSVDRDRARPTMPNSLDAGIEDTRERGVGFFYPNATALIRACCGDELDLNARAREAASRQPLRGPWGRGRGALGAGGGWGADRHAGNASTKPRQFRAKIAMAQYSAMQASSLQPTGAAYAPK